MKIIEKTLSKNYNVSIESEKSLFFRYAGFFMLLFAAIYALFFIFSYLVVYIVSIEDEQRLFGWEESIFSGSLLPDVLQERYSNTPYSIELIDMDGEQNAFASLGGKIYITQSLLENIETYEALDFIVGHEIGHIENRDVLKSLVSKIPVVLLLSLFGGDYGAVIFDGIIGNTHGKIMESRADIYGLDFVYEKNKHVGCAIDFFIKNNSISDNLLEVFSTHPMTDLRIKRAQKYIDEKKYEIRECSLLIL